MSETENLPEQGFLTLSDHLVELRKRLIWTVLIIFIGFCICFYFSEFLFDVLRRPIQAYLPKTPDGKPGGLVFLSVTEKFMSHVKMSAVAGAVLTTPFWLYQIWAFVAPGLYKKEQKYAVVFIFSGTVLFLVGASFAYFLALPGAYEFLLGFGGGQDFPMITISEHISFLTSVILIFGAVFEIPLILTLLGLMGIVDVEFLAKNRRYAVVINSIFAAIFSPPDLMSMILVLVPMVILYEISILVLRVVIPKKSEANGTV